MAARLVLVCVAVAFLSACSSSGSSTLLPGPQWGRERADNLNNANGASLVFNTKGTFKWCTDLHAPIRTTPDIGVNGTVYVATDAGVSALSPTNGSVQWTFSADAPVGSSPAIDPEDRVFFGDDAGFVHGLDAHGQELWPAFDTQTLGGARSAIRTSPLLEYDFVENRTTALFVGTDDGRIAAIDGGDGTLHWQFQTSAPIAGSLATDFNGTIFVPALNDELFGLVRDGSNPYPAPGAVSVQPITEPVVGTAAILQVVSSSDGRGRLTALTPDLFGSRWTFAASGALTSPPATFSHVVTDRTRNEAVVLDSSGDLYFVDQMDGSNHGLCDGGVNDGMPCGGDADCSGGTCGPIYSVGATVVAAPVIGIDGTVLIGTAPDSGNTARLYAVQRRLCDGGQHLGESCQSDKDCQGSGGSISGNCLLADEPTTDPNQDGNPFVTTRWVFSGDAACAGAGVLAPIVASPSIATDGTVYVGTEDGYLYALNGSR